MFIKLITVIIMGGLAAFTSTNHQVIYGLVALIVSAAILFSDYLKFSKSKKPLFLGFIGMGLGLWFSSIVYDLILKTPHLSFFSQSPLLFYIALGLGGFYFGMQGLSKVGFFQKEESENPKATQSEGIPAKILDTSAIIDSRIIDVCETGFVEGVVLIPKFVLNELQHVADSTDPLKRSRGRKGLTELSRLKKSKAIIVKIIEKDYPQIREVDHKLIKMGQEEGAALVTTDYNLNKLASLEGVRVLNVNELANALKPVVMTHEVLDITVIKEGKDPNQGIGYLDDGTMVVVDGGKNYLGHDLQVVVTSVLQTAAGRMIFTQPKNPELLSAGVRK